MNKNAFPVLNHLGLLLVTTLLTVSPSNAQYYKKDRPILELPIRVYTLEFEAAPTLDAKTRGADIPEIINALNKIYERAGIRWKLLSMGPMTIKARKLNQYDGDARITEDSGSIRYKLVKSIEEATPRGEYRVYFLKNFPRGEAEPAFYDPYLRAIFFAENTQKWGKSHWGMLAQMLGTSLGLVRLEASNNMMFRRWPKSAAPEDNKLIENQVVRARQMAEIELATGQSLKNASKGGQYNANSQTNGLNPLDPSKPTSIFD